MKILPPKLFCTKSGKKKSGTKWIINKFKLILDGRLDWMSIFTITYEHCNTSNYRHSLTSITIHQLTRCRTHSSISNTYFNKNDNDSCSLSCGFHDSLSIIKLFEWIQQVSFFLLLLCHFLFFPLLLQFLFLLPSNSFLSKTLDKFVDEEN